MKNFIVDNPLCVCSEEISNIKRRVLQENDEIRLKQKTSQVVIKLKQDAYHLNARLTVPNDYPLERTGSVQGTTGALFVLSCELISSSYG